MRKQERKEAIFKERSPIRVMNMFLYFIKRNQGDKIVDLNLNPVAL